MLSSSSSLIPADFAAVVAGALAFWLHAALPDKANTQQPTPTIRIIIVRSFEVITPHRPAPQGSSYPLVMYLSGVYELAGGPADVVRRPGQAARHAARSITVALAVSGVFWHLAGVAVLAAALALGRRPAAPWWRPGPAVLLALGLLVFGLTIARGGADFDPD